MIASIQSNLAVLGAFLAFVLCAGLFQCLLLRRQVNRKTASLLEELEKRKGAEDALRESQLRLELALAGSDLGIWDRNVQTGELAFNKQWTQMLGYSPGEVAGHLDEWKKLVHPDDLPRILAAMDDHFEGRSAMYKAEFRLRAKSGEWKWVLSRGRAVERDADGKPLRVSGTHLDITERKRADVAEQRRTEELAKRIKEFHCLYEVSMLMTDATRPVADILQSIVRLVPPAWQYPAIARARIACLGLEYESNGFKETEWKQSADINIGEDRAGSLEVCYMEERPVASEGPFLKEERALLDTLAREVGRFAARHIAEESLRTSENRLALAVQSTGLGVYEHEEPPGDECYHSEGWAAILGYRPEELPPQAERMQWVLEQLHPADRPILEAAYSDFVEGKTPEYNVEVRIRHKSGDWICVSGMAKAMARDADGRVTHVLGLMQDISARKEAEAVVRESEERYRALFEQAADCIALIDTDEEHVTEFNDVAHNTFGYTREEFAHLALADLAAPETHQDIRRRLKTVVEMGSDEFETMMCTKEGEARDVFVAVKKISIRERSYFLVVWRDITRQKLEEANKEELDAQIQHTQKLESLGVLAGGIAHDFNNLLVGILGNADLALDELDPGSSAARTVAEMKTAAKNAAELTRQMLAYSGRGKFLVQPISLSDVVKTMGHLLEVSVSKQAVLRYRLADDLPSVEADVSQIRQVVMNLILNASEAIEGKSGVISVSTGASHCDTEYLERTYLNDGLPPGDYVYVEVADTGPGMDEETRDRMFDPFYTTKFAGRGLGLAAVLGIVRGHKGAINVYSEAGEGTTVKVMFPASDKQAEEMKEKPEGAAWRGTGTVLLVDDEETVRVVVRRMLEKTGFTVLTACDGLQATEVLADKADDISCVLLDLTMPHLGGEETFGRLREIKDDVPIILSSGYNEQEAVSRFAGKGLAGFIQKPYDAAALAAKLKEVLAG